MSSMYGNSGLMGPTGQRGNKIPSGYKAGQLQQFTPEQVQLFQQLFSHVNPQSYLSKLAGGDEAAFEQMEAPVMRQFQGIQGQLASRFSGMGLGGRKSSGFQNTMTAAGSNFAQDLQANRQALQRQALMDLMGISKELLGERPYQSYLLPKQEKTNWGAILGGLMGIPLGNVLNPLGSTAGKRADEYFSQKLFGG